MPRSTLNVHLHCCQCHSISKTLLLRVMLGFAMTNSTLVFIINFPFHFVAKQQSGPHAVMMALHLVQQHQYQLLFCDDITAAMVLLENSNASLYSFANVSEVFVRNSLNDMQRNMTKRNSLFIWSFVEFFFFLDISKQMRIFI